VTLQRRFFTEDNEGNEGFIGFQFHSVLLTIDAGYTMENWEEKALPSFATATVETVVGLPINPSLTSVKNLRGCGPFGLATCRALGRSASSVESLGEGGSEAALHGFLLCVFKERFNAFLHLAHHGGAGT